MYVCMYVCMFVRRYACMYVCMYVCMHVCMYVCMYVCLYVCMLSVSDRAFPAFRTRVFKNTRSRNALVSQRAQRLRSQQFPGSLRSQIAAFLAFLRFVCVSTAPRPTAFPMRFQDTWTYEMHVSSARLRSLELDMYPTGEGDLRRPRTIEAESTQCMPAAQHRASLRTSLTSNYLWPCVCDVEIKCVFGDRRRRMARCCV